MSETIHPRLEEIWNDCKKRDERTNAKLDKMSAKERAAQEERLESAARFYEPTSGDPDED